MGSWRYDPHEYISWWNKHFTYEIWRDHPIPRLCPPRFPVFGRDKFVEIVDVLEQQKGETVKMLVVYLAHQLSAPTHEGIEQNRRNAAKWAAWLWRQGFSVECSWIVCTGELEETPENRELGLKSDCEQARRCDVMVLCGPKISSGMLREAGAAKVLIDFTYLGLELPTPELGWHSGAPVTLQEIERLHR